MTLISQMVSKIVCSIIRVFTGYEAKPFTDRLTLAPHILLYLGLLQPVNIHCCTTADPKPMNSTSQDTDKVALYIRVAHSLRSRINRGEWPAGTQLPTFVELAAEYGVALVTIRQAAALLAQDGLISSGRGRGTFVEKHVQPIRENANLKMAINSRLELPSNTSIKVLSRNRSTQLPEAFDHSPEPRYPEYVTICKLHQIDGEPFALLNVSVASSIYDRFAPGADKKSRIFRLVLEQGGLRLLSSRIEMTLEYADQEMARLLRCPPLTALVRIQTWRVDTGGKLVIATDSYYLGHKFVYAAEERDIELTDTDPIALPTTRSRGKAQVKSKQ